MLSENLQRRMAQTLCSGAGIWDAYDGSHVIVVATFGTNPGRGVPSVEEIALMLTDENWIP